MTDASACSMTPSTPAALTTCEVRFHHAERAVVAQSRVLANEVPIALVFNGISHAVMMGTPLDLEDFAIGFALSEGIIDHASDCYGIDVRPVDAAAAGLPAGMNGMQVQVDISSRCFARLKDHRRSISGRTGCGVCGVESFAALDLSFDALPARDWVSQVDLPTVLTGRDLLGIAQTGTGKTAAFMLPSLQRLHAARRIPKPQQIRMLVLAPTRELASQIAASAEAYGKQLRTSVGVIFGGTAPNKSVRTVARGLDVLVATPGRLLDLVEQRAINLSELEILVLDEADQMLDRGADATGVVEHDRAERSVIDRINDHDWRSADRH